MSDKDLIQDVNESFEEEKQKQAEILEEIGEEHGGNLIETKCNITPKHTVDISVNLNGRFIDRMADVEELAQQTQEEGKIATSTSQIADEMADLLAGAIVDTTWNKELFYNIYLDNDLEALGELFKNVSDSIRQERERKAGAVDGFRQE